MKSPLDEFKLYYEEHFQNKREAKKAQARRYFQDILDKRRRDRRSHILSGLYRPVQAFNKLVVRTVKEIFRDDD